MCGLLAGGPWEGAVCVYPRAVEAAPAPPLPRLRVAFRVPSRCSGCYLPVHVARGCGGPGRGLCEGCWWPRLPEAQAGSVGGEAPRGPGGQCGWRGSPRPRRAVWVAEAPRGPGGQCGWRGPSPASGGSPSPSFLALWRGGRPCPSPTMSTSLEFWVGWEWPRVLSVLVYAELNARAAVPSPRVFLSVPPRRAALLQGHADTLVVGGHSSVPCELACGLWGAPRGAGGRGSGKEQVEPGCVGLVCRGAGQGSVSARAARLWRA